MPTISSLITQLSVDFTNFRFTPGDTFRWSPSEMTIYYQTTSSDCPALLHEVSHAVLNHQTYTRDVQLIEFEQAAWNYAQAVLSPQYDIAITSQQIEESLDTYRDWLHARSTCPKCQATGLQTKRQLYSCIVCRAKWRPNDARLCELRRFIVN